VNVDSPSWLYNKVLVLHYKDGYEWDDLKVGQKNKSCLSLKFIL